MQSFPWRIIAVGLVLPDANAFSFWLIVFAQQGTDELSEGMQ